MSTGKLREGVANSFLYLLAQLTVDLYLVWNTFTGYCLTVLGAVKKRKLLQ